MLLFNLSYVRLIMQIASIFLIILSNIMGLRFPGGLFLSWFWERYKYSLFNIFWIFPVFAVLFRISSMPSFISFGPYFSCAAVMLSIPALLLFFSNLWPY